MKEEGKLTLTDEVVMEKIHLIRDKKVMLDEDLAELYDVETKRLNEQIKRNIARFPEDFMFQLSQKEFDNLKSQIATSSWGGRRKLPYAFTEQGVAMLSGVLHSERAIKVNIHIMRVFSRMREIIVAHKKILEYIKRLKKTRQDEVEFKDRPRIGYEK
jgi:phage regulator Rha-like protein